MNSPQPVGQRATLVVEDIRDTREWLAGVMERMTGAPVDTAATLAAARAWLGQQAPASAPLVLVDLGLPDGSGTSFIRELMHRLPQAMAVVTTIFDDDAHLLNAMAAGAQGYLLKDGDPEDITERLRRIELGDIPISPAMARLLLHHFRQQASFVSGGAAGGGQREELTARETETLRFIGRGLKVSEVAGVMGIATNTVASYVKTIYRKLGISTRAEAALEAARRGLV